jgi:hypothetical protein
MDDHRFDSLTRWVGTNQTRRGALRALAGSALGVGGVATATRDEASALTCDICQKKRRGRCRQRRVGAICGDGGSCCAPGLCCAKEQICFSADCQGCPGTSACTVHPVCGYFSSRSEDYCLCITSVEGETTCSSLFGACFECTTDQECTDELGVPSVCMDLSGCTRSCRDTGKKLCFVKGCEQPAARATAASTDGGETAGLKRMTQVFPGR